MGKCSWCETEGEVYADNGRCEECDTDVIFCKVCKRLEHRDSKCRHVFQDRDLQWCGSGVVGGYFTPAVKRAFFDLLTLMPDGFAPDLRAAIKGGRFYTWVIAPMIGGGGMLELNGMPARDGRFMTFVWGDAMIEISQGADAEEVTDGYRWLASLYQRSTRAANRTTIGWIDEWQREQVPRAGLWAWHWRGTAGAQL